MGSGFGGSISSSQYGQMASGFGVLMGPGQYGLMGNGYAGSGVLNLFRLTEHFVPKKMSAEQV